MRRESSPAVVVATSWVDPTISSRISNTETAFRLERTETP